MAKQLLIENDAGYFVAERNEGLFNESREIVFDVSKPIFIDCILQKYGVENRNGRIYTEEILKREDQRYQEFIKSNSALNEVNHPNDSNINLNNLGHLIKRTWWEDNVLWGTLEIITSPGYHKMGICSLPGDTIAELLKRKVRLGISSRGVGSLKTQNGKNIVQDDFELICFDLVASPSTPGAYLFTQTIKNLEEDNKQPLIKSIYNESLIKNLDNFLLG
jgi:hypothetical protein